MDKDFEFTSPAEEELVTLLRDLTKNLPKINVWLIHPVNYPRATKAIEEILTVLHKESPDAEHEITFDELLGSNIVLTVKDWTYGFCGCKDIARAISMADTFDIEATLEGKVVLHFGFKDTLLPVPPKA